MHLSFFPIDYALLLCDTILYMMHENGVSAYVSLFHPVVNMSLINLCLFFAFDFVIFWGSFANRQWRPICRRKSIKPEQPG